MINLSEGLAPVPGLVVANRSNYAQDLQISSRGFGARAGFGVRGIRLYADGIPATMPDGQGQVAHFDLAGATRVEVLRGRSGLMNLRWRHGLKVTGLGELQLLARLDNLLRHAHVGSVIVNDANGRFFEPGAPRAALLSVRRGARW